MVISVGESIIIIAVCAACTFFERLLPFLIFGNRPVPKVIKYLGRILPMAVMSTLAIYCLRNTNFSSVGGFLPQLVAVAITAALHAWKSNSMLSIFGGTAIYMILIRVL